MSRVDVLPALVSRLSTVQIGRGGAIPSAPRYPDSFDAEISKFGIYKRWVLRGSALRVWEDDLRSRVLELIRQNEGEIYNGHGLREATTYHCWMLGRDQPSAKPTVVIAHGVRRILKRTMRVIDKHKILKERGFELRGCPNCDLQLLTDTSSAQLTQHVDSASLHLPLSLCGAEVAVGDPARYATLGGILTVAEELYAITVAHVFTEIVQAQTRNAVSDSNLILYDMDWANSSSEDCSLEDDSSEGDCSDEEDAANVGVSGSTTLDMSKVKGLPPFDHSNHERAIQMGEFPLYKLSSESPFRNNNDNSYDGMDWALLNVPRPWYHCVNGALRNDTSWLHFEKIREDGPSGPVLIVTRKGVVNGVGAGTASSIKLKGSSTYRNVWSVQSDHPLDRGDSGAWVVDATTGDLYGVIVAASTVMHEGYLIPASEIIKDIQRATGVAAVKLPIERTDDHFTLKAVIDYKNRLMVTYDRLGRTDYELRQLNTAQNAMQTSHLEVRQEASHLGNTLASHSQISEMELGKEHPDMLKTTLAKILGDQSKREEKMLRQVLPSIETIPGQENPRTLTIKTTLVMILNDQNKHEEAEKMLRQILPSMETILGQEHPNTLTSINTLAKVLSRQIKYEEAEKTFRQVLPLMETILGKEHPDTLISIVNLAVVLNDQGKYDEADKLFQRVMISTERVLGREHPSTLTCVYGFANSLYKKKQYQAAQAFCYRAYTGYRTVLGEEHPTTVECLKHYSLMLEEEKGRSRDSGEEAKAHGL